MQRNDPYKSDPPVIKLEGTSTCRPSDKVFVIHLQFSNEDIYCILATYWMKKRQAESTTLAENHHSQQTRRVPLLALGFPLL